MGFFEWLGISPRDAPELPEVEDNLRDSGQTFVFGKADSGERVDEKSAMQIATVYGRKSDYVLYLLNLLAAF